MTKRVSLTGVDTPLSATTWTASETLISSHVQEITDLHPGFGGVAGPAALRHIDVTESGVGQLPMTAMTYVCICPVPHSITT